MLLDKQDHPLTYEAELREQQQQQQQVYFKLSQYSLQSLCPQLAKAIRGGYKRKKKIL